MAETRVVSALIAKRAELAGQLEAAQAEVRRLVIDLDNLDATLRLFKPDIDLAEIKPKPLPPRAAAYKGEVARIVLGTLRSSPEPLTTEQLAEHVMAERNLNAADKRMLCTVSKRVGACLRHYRNKGVLRSERAVGGRVMWAAAPASSR
jgi:hypothetical protein